MKNKLLLIILYLGLNFKNLSTMYLFKKFPNFTLKIPHISLCDLPTPILKLDKFGKKIGCKNIYIKRDDLSGKKLANGLRLYGGNKPRKLEFILADALNKKAKFIITYGCAGSNHALATSVYANEMGFKTFLMLLDQPNSYVVRHNLLTDKFYNANLEFFKNCDDRNKAKDNLLKEVMHTYFIPTGGSNALGTLGFINAAFELHSQIQKGEIKEPDYIYVSTGTSATTAGLLFGIKLLNLKTKLVAVCIEPEKLKDEFLTKIKNLFYQTNKFLNDLDSTFKMLEFPENNLILNKKFCGTEYGLIMPETLEAIKIFKDLENIKLEGTYTAKPVAAIIEDAKNNIIKDETILFWNTYCGIDYSSLSSFYEYKNLPKEFHKYFEEDVQKLDMVL